MRSNLSSFSLPTVLAVVLAATPTLAASSDPASSCGTTVTVRAADTLSRIAERCDVTEAALLNANPTIQGSGDLHVGSTLRIDEGNSTAQNVDAALTAVARRASTAIGSLAGDVGTSVQDLLDKNPDLKSRVDRLGNQVALTGKGQAATATVSPQTGPSGSTVSILARGLAPNSPVAIGAGPPGTAYSVIGHAQSTADGAMAATLKVPDSTKRGQVVVFSVATGSGVAARTGRFVVTR